MKIIKTQQLLSIIATASLTLFMCSLVNGQLDIEISHAIKIGDTNTEDAGTIRWNPTSEDFEGYDGEQWLSLTRPMLLQELPPDSNSLIPAYADTVISINSESLLGRQVAIDSNQAIVLGRNINFYHKSGQTWAPDTSINIATLTTNGLNNDMHLSDDQLFIGYESSNTTGDVAILQQVNSAWILDTILHEENARKFGSDVRYNGTYLVIGADGTILNGQSNEGKVYIYKKLNGQWTKHAEIENPDTADSGTFGKKIDIDNNYLMIASSTYTYVYAITGDLFSFLHRWEIGAEDVALSPNQLFIGETNTDIDTFRQGAVFIYDKSNISTPSDTLYEKVNDLRLGSSLSVENNILLVGAFHHNNFGADKTGKALVYYHDGTQWSLQETLVDPVGQSEDSFGFAVDLYGSNYIIGAPKAEVNGAINKGKFFIGSFD